MSQDKKDVKMLTAAEIKQRIGATSDEGEFPIWATAKFAKTHKLRWISQRKFYGDDMEVDTRGYEVVKNPETGQVQRWKEMVLGAIPLDLAAERKAAVEDLTRSQEQAVVDNIENRQEALQYELERMGYGSKGRSPKFNYNSSKKK